MNSPFKMKPGRGNMPKTGSGIPPALMTCSPMKQEPKKKNPVTGNQTPAYTPGELGGSFDWNQSNRTTYNPNSPNFNPKLVGATFNPSTGNWDANKVEKFEVFKQPNSEAINVIKRGGNTILRNTSGGDESSIGNKLFNEKAKEAYGTYVRDSLSTAHSNERQARKYDARTAGSAPESKESKDAMNKYQAAKVRKVLEEKKKKGQI